MIVYLVRNRANGKGYVGKTTRDLDQRWKEHVRNALARHDEMPVYAAIRKHGPDTFDVSVLEECASTEQLDAAERRWIAELGTFGLSGYNATRGGDGITGYRHTDDAKRRMSEARRGEKNVNWGGLSEEHRRRVSEGRKGKGLGNKSALGYHHTEEAKARIGAATAIRKRKAVVQVSKEGTVLNVFPSLQDAAQTVNGQANKISEVLCGHRRTHKGYVWQYALDGGNTADRVEV